MKRFQVKRETPNDLNALSLSHISQGGERLERGWREGGEVEERGGREGGERVERGWREGGARAEREERECSKRRRVRQDCGAARST